MKLNSEFRLVKITLLIFSIIAAEYTIQAASFDGATPKNEYPDFDHSFISIPPTNPFYLAKYGKAELLNGEMISGKFYYHTPLFGKDDSFYFYPTDIKSLKIIEIGKIKSVEFVDHEKKAAIFFLKDDRLERVLSNGQIQKLNPSVLMKL
jgi:hypothetical protein